MVRTRQYDMVREVVLFAIVQESCLTEIDTEKVCGYSSWLDRMKGVYKSRSKCSES